MGLAAPQVLPNNLQDKSKTKGSGGTKCWNLTG